MKHECAGGLRVRDPVDRRAGVASFGILARREHDGHGRAVRKRQVRVAEVAARRSGKRAEEVSVDPRQDRLRLRISEPAIEFEHLRTLVGEHQARVQRPDERRAASGQFGQHRPVHDVDDVLGIHGHRRVRAHPARVRPRVAVPDTLEVLRGRKRDRTHAVAECEHRDFLALQELFDHDRVAVRRDTAETGVQFGLVAAYEDAFARGEAVRLEDAGRSRNGERLGRRDAGCPHHVLGELLRSFDPGGGGARAEHGDPGVAQLVGNAGNERRLRADHDEVDVECAGKREQALAVLRSDRVTRAEAGDARIPGRRVELSQLVRLAQLPGERVLAPPGADQQHLHRPHSNQRGRRV